MRGTNILRDILFSTVSPEQLVPKDCPLCLIRQMVDEALKALGSDFNALYADMGRDSIPPEIPLRVRLLMALYTLRSKCQLVEQLDYNLLFCWFVGFSMDDEVWRHSAFTKNRDHLLEGEVAHRFFAQMLAQANQADLLSKEHSSIDGALIDALVSLKNYRPKDENEPPIQDGGRNPSIDFRGEKRSMDTHESRTDPDELLFKRIKGTAAKPSYMGYILMENSHGLVIDAIVTQVTGTAERKTAIEMVEALNGTHCVMVGEDKDYEMKGLVESMRGTNATSHVAQNDINRSSVIDGQATRHEGCKTGQTIRKQIEECFGWGKTIGGLRKSLFIGGEKLDFQFVLTFATYSLVRMRNRWGVPC